MPSLQTFRNVFAKLIAVDKHHNLMLFARFIPCHYPVSITARSRYKQVSGVHVGHKVFVNACPQHMLRIGLGNICWLPYDAAFDSEDKDVIRVGTPPDLTQADVAVTSQTK